MTHVRQLPRSVMTWGLMLLTVIAGGVRPSCICADGTLCVFCPKLMAASAALSATETGATSGSCSTKSCCCEHASTPPQPKMASVCDLVGSTCEERDCLTIQAASPVIVQTNDDPTSRLESKAVPTMLATVESSLSRDSFRSPRSTHRAGPPPDLIVLFQRWRI